MRLFIAILLPESVVAHLRGVWDALPKRPAVASVRPENWHVTLKFLGECEPGRVDAIAEAIGHAASTPAFELHPAGMEFFPPRGRVRVIAVSLEGEVDKLIALHAEIERRLELLDFAREDRPFREHITLGRARTPLPAGVRDEFARATATVANGPRFTVGAISLMRSELTPAGPIYSELKRIELGGNSIE